LGGVENYSFSGQIPFIHIVATQLLVSPFLCRATASPARTRRVRTRLGSQASSAHQQFREKARNGKTINR
jgi:hypothetical protein